MNCFRNQETAKQTRYSKGFSEVVKGGDESGPARRMVFRSESPIRTRGAWRAPLNGAWRMKYMSETLVNRISSLSGRLRVTAPRSIIF